ncbi:hypothetical protein [Parvularcula oceani]|uniref:hypothetical protein n=1 Tax=Parvularcula oceani TaxID=1247963 RepID=UPI0004E22496|nr:hypothetical protein [Parvularcula oceani]
MYLPTFKFATGGTSASLDEVLARGLEAVVYAALLVIVVRGGGAGHGDLSWSELQALPPLPEGSLLVLFLIQPAALYLWASYGRWSRVVVPLMALAFAAGTAEWLHDYSYGPENVLFASGLALAFAAMVALGRRPLPALMVMAAMVPVAVYFGVLR